MDFRRSELKAFLRARRAVLKPEDFGLPRGTRRLASGLRREELAAIAGVGLTWYTWLEQGREIMPSAETLHRISKALRLSDTDEAHLFLLAGLPRDVKYVAPREVPLAIDRVLSTFQGPAVVLDPMFNLVAWNGLAGRLYNFEDAVEPFPGNQLWQFFINPARRALYPDYESVGAAFVALFRSAAIDVTLPQYQHLIEALQSASSKFQELWNMQSTTAIAPQTVRITHPEFGDIEVYSVRSILPTLGQSLLFLLAPANEETAKAFGL